MNGFATVCSRIGRLCFRPGCYGIALVVLIAAGALMFRLHRLELRPFHVDEGVQAVKAGELYDSGHYQYNPFEFHGPSLYYFTLPVLKLSGAKSFAATRDADFRVVPVLFGVGLILLLLPLRRDLGSVAMLTAAVLTAVSPAMVFFSRYYIQEMLLVFFAALAWCALWRYFRSRRRRWIVLLGLALGLMYATKETSVIFYGAMAVAYSGLVLRRRHRDGRPLWNPQRQHACMLLSSFFAHARGPLDSLLAFRHYFDRSAGDGSAALHQHPWYYYLQMLIYTHDAPGPWWSEGLILVLAAVGLITSVRGQAPAITQPCTQPTAWAIDPDLAFFLAVYTICMTLVYAIIPYKTPWNMLGFLHGLILMAGIGAAALLHRLPRFGARAVLVSVLLLAAGQLAAQAWRANFRFCADPRNPYVYAHSVPDVIRLSRRIHEIAALHADGPSMPIHVITPDYWPLPYYLRQLKRIGYWSEIPTSPDAPVIVASAAMQEPLEPLLKDHYHTAYYGLRPGVLLVLNIRQDLWDRYLMEK
ncbi:MAG: glycosyltransferase family 39 protein [Verrucomicrobia bacterium]|nr:glycosyltransferase family 39 protein [Verrucomicrobiota bacterium]